MADQRLFPVPVLPSPATRWWTPPTPLAVPTRSAVSVARLIRLAWLEARPVVQLMFQLRFATGAAIAGGLTMSRSLLLGALAWLCASWHIYLLNGLCDQVEDRRNGSGRPLADGRLPVAAARRIAWALAALALVVAVAVSPLFCVLVVVFLALGFVYSAGPRPQKAVVWGFVAVVTGGGLTTYVAGWVAGGGRLSPELVVVAITMSLWMALAGTTKDLSDVEGDRLAGRRTLPVLFGDRIARRIMALLTLGVAGWALASALWWAPELLAAVVVLASGAVTVAVSVLQAPSTTDRRRQRRPYRLFMLSQLATHVVVLAGI